MKPIRYLLIVGWLLGFPACSLATELPRGFVQEILATNLHCATAIAAAPDGRVFVAEQTGRLLIWKNGGLLAQPALTLHVADYWERGLIGVTLAPDFPRAPHLFILYVTDKPVPHHVLSRFTLQGDVADPLSEQVLFEGDDQGKLGGTQVGAHQGGPLRFGNDGKLYVALGEQTAGEPSQRLDTLLGKILRLNADGSIPEDNPFFDKTVGKYRAIWAYGVRNPFGLATQRESGRMFFTDVGQSSFEEVNELTRGANYGWPRFEGYSTNAGFKSPLYAYPPVIGRSICGAAFYPKTLAAPAVGFPEKWRGKFFFADFMNHWVKALDPDAPTNVLTFGRGLNGPVAVEADADGSLLVLNRGTIWRDPKRVVANSGSLVRLRYTGEPLAQAPASTSRTLSGAGVFRSLETLEPMAGFIPFELNSPLWIPGVVAQRWLSIPPGTKIRFSAEGDWGFPSGTIFIQHFALTAKPAGRASDRFETQVIWISEDRCHRAGAYRWNADGREAFLIEDSEITPLPAGGKLNWFSPGAEDCLVLDTMVSGFVLQLNTRQLNREVRDPRAQTRENQLRAFNRRGLFEPPLRDEQFAALPRLTGLDDAAAPAEMRVRSYLDANCAVCHRPGGASRGNFDARFNIRLEEQRILNGELAAGDLGISGARVVTPGDVNKSILYQRLKRTDFFRMPPVSVNDQPSPILPVLKEWIEGMRAARAEK